MTDNLPAEPPRRVNGAALGIVNPHELPLITLLPGTKEPLRKEFYLHASPDPSEIPPEHNAGVLTGGGLIVLDLDVKNEKDGRKAR